MRRILATALLGCACQPASVTSPNTKNITSAEIRSRIDHYACAAWIDEISAYEARFGDSRCTSEPSAPSPLDTAIAAGVADAAVVVPLAAGAYDRAYAELDVPGGRSNHELDAVVRAIYWSDPHLGPAAENRVVVHLAKSGIRCSDCSVSVPQAHVLDWGKFELHVLAYMWPERVEDEQTHIHVCSARNGVEALGLSESMGLEAGFLAALALAEDAEIQASIRSLLVENPAPEAARIAVERMLDTEQAREVACARVSESAWFTGLQVPECRP